MCLRIFDDKIKIYKKLAEKKTIIINNKKYYYGIKDFIFSNLKQKATLTGMFKKDYNYKFYAEDLGLNHKASLKKQPIIYYLSGDNYISKGEDLTDLGVHFSFDNIASFDLNYMYQSLPILIPCESLQLLGEDEEGTAKEFILPNFIMWEQIKYLYNCDSDEIDYIYIFNSLLKNAILPAEKE